MAPALAKGSVAPGATLVALGLASTGLLLLLLLCSFFHRANRQFSTQKMKESSGLVRGVRLVRLGCSARAAGSPSQGEPQPQAAGPAVLGDPDNPAGGTPGLHAPGWTPRSQALPEPALRTPEFLRHRELPGVPGVPSTPAGVPSTPPGDPAPDAEGPIYESIRYKPGTLREPWGGDTAWGDPPSPPAGDEPSAPEQEISPGAPGSGGSPGPVYARVCRAPRAPRPPPAASPPQSREGAAPSLPEQRFGAA